MPAPRSCRPETHQLRTTIASGVCAFTPSPSAHCHVPLPSRQALLSSPTTTAKPYFYCQVLLPSRTPTAKSNCQALLLQAAKCYCQVLLLLPSPTVKPYSYRQVLLS